MTYEQVMDLDGIPQMHGLLMYPWGVPMNMTCITWIDDETLQDKFLRRCKDVIADQPFNQEDERLLKNYIIYYIHAPIFQKNGTTQELFKKDLLSMSLQELISECLNIGIDPL